MPQHRERTETALDLNRVALSDRMRTALVNEVAKQIPAEVENTASVCRVVGTGVPNAGARTTSKLSMQRPWRESRARSSPSWAVPSSRGSPSG